MQLQRFDHLVLTTQNLDACLHFYVEILGMRHLESNGRHALYFGQQKVNIHTRKGEFQPAAAVPTYGGLDLCLITDTELAQVKDELVQKGWPILEGIVERSGALGKMDSLYLRDPDGNLIELAHYRAEA